MSNSSMDPDYIKQPSKHPSSNQRKHHRPVTATNNAEGSSVARRKERSSSIKGSKSVINNLFESKESLAEENHDYLVSTSNFVNASETNTGHVKGKSKQREVGKVKPIRIIQPSHELEKTKFDNSRKLTTAWDEPLSDAADNQKNVGASHEEYQDNNEDFNGRSEEESPEKMFINTSDLGSKYYFKSGVHSRAAHRNMVPVEKADIVVREADNFNDHENNKNKMEDRGELTQHSRHHLSNMIEENVNETDEFPENPMKHSTPSLGMIGSSMSVSRVSSSSSGSERVKVIVRCRPISQKEVNQGHEW